MFEQVWKSYISKQNLDSVRICPICDYIGRFESNGGENGVICPQCKSRERDRLYWMYISKDNYLSKRRFIYHVNPDPATKTRMKDFSSVHYKSLGLNNIAVSGPEKADLFIANYMLNRVDDIDSVLDTIHSCLSGNGVLMASLFFSKEGTDLSSNPRKYTFPDYKAKLEEKGFLVSLITGEELCGSFLAFVCGIRPSDAIVIARPVKD